MKKKTQTLLNDSKIFIPTRHKGGRFRKPSGVEIDISFIPLICTELYKKLMTLQNEFIRESKKYREIKDDYDKKKVDSDTLIEASQEIERQSNEVRDTTIKFVLSIIAMNDNDPEWATEDWIMNNFSAVDINQLISESMLPSEEKKRSQKISKIILRTTDLI